MSARQSGTASAPRSQSRRFVQAALGLALAGLAMSAYLTFVHLKLHQEIGYRSGCSISATVSCDAVAMSDYGTLLGLPVALWGAWFYAALAFVAALGLRGGRRLPRSPAVWLALAGGFSFLLSVALAGISAFVIKAFCPVCVGLYAVNIGLLIVGVLSLRSTGEGFGTALGAELSAVRRMPGEALMFAGAPLLILVGAALGYPKGFKPVDDLCAAAKASGGKLTMEVYTDFQCPHCKIADTMLRSLRSSKTLTVVHRQFPLDMECNPLLKRPLHVGSCLQALAAVCAGKQGRYDAMSDAIFDRDLRTLPDLRAVAQQSGMDLPAFDACLGSPAVREEMLKEIRQGVDRGIEGTPTAFIVGRQYQGGWDWPSFKCLE
jgi:uncharacterized membrane protein/protein-disulfide isomerase